MSGELILIVDDDVSIRRFLSDTLITYGYRVELAVSGLEALAKANGQHPDLIILDIGLPDLDGIEVTRRLREWTATPIIILSVREHEQDKIHALDAGADDYLTKPFSSGELLARMRVSLRHSRQNESPVVQMDDLYIDFANRLVMVANNEVSLNPTEFHLLQLLATRAGRVLTHTQLLKEVWGPGYEYKSHLLRQNISTLRHKIEQDPSRPKFILTEPGVGYRFKI